MSRTIGAFPPGPLNDETLAAFEESDRVDAIRPVSRMPKEDRIYAVMLVTENSVYGVAFDRETRRWHVVEEQDRAKDEQATGAVDAAIAEWMNDRYGEQYLFPADG